MAHLISNTEANYLDSDCIIKIPCRQVVTSRFRSKMRNIHVSAPDQGTAQEGLIMRMCNKLSQKQLRKIKLDNEIQLHRKFDRLKRKMRSSVKSKESMVSKFFDSKDINEPKLSTLLKNYPQRIDINHKYYLKIQSKIGCIKQAKEIKEQKEKYQNWLNSNNNSPIKSPNYTKMNYVLQRINSKKQLGQILKPIRLSHNQKNGWFGSVTKVNQAQYSPKKRFPFQKRNNIEFPSQNR